MTEVAWTRSRLIEALGENQEAYFAHLKSWFKKKSTKDEFDCAARKLLSANELTLHNDFFVAILNKCHAPEDAAAAAAMKKDDDFVSRSGGVFANLKPDSEVVFVNNKEQLETMKYSEIQEKAGTRHLVHVQRSKKEKNQAGLFILHLYHKLFKLSRLLTLLEQN